MGSLSCGGYTILIHLFVGTKKCRSLRKDKREEGSSMEEESYNRDKTTKFNDG